RESPFRNPRRHSTPPRRSLPHLSTKRPRKTYRPECRFHECGYFARRLPKHPRKLPKSNQRRPLVPGPLAVIGVDAAEIRWIKTLLSLLRHPDPSVPQLTRQALLYLNDDAAKRKDS